MKNSEKKDWKNSTVEERFKVVERLRREHWKGIYDENTRIDKTVFRIIRNGVIIKESGLK